jgi:hypothetical protein
MRSRTTYLGKQLGNPLLVSSSTKNLTWVAHPHLIWTGTELAAAWEEEDDANNRYVSFVRIDKQGKRLAGGTNVSGNISTSVGDPTVANIPEKAVTYYKGRYTAAWRERNDVEGNHALYVTQFSCGAVAE